MKVFKRLFCHSIARYIIAFAIIVFITIVVLLNSTFTYVGNYANGIITGSCVAIFFGLLALVSFYGTFNIFGYAFQALRGVDRKYHDLYEYNQAKDENRKYSNYTFMPYITVGVVFLIIGLLLNLFC